MSPRSTVDTPPRPLEVAIVGNDAVLAALPARPMQLAHAVLACGFDLVVPVSWGEEVLAEHTLRAISARGNAPAIYCACPSLRARLLSAGSELAPYLISVVAPSVATARYLRALDPSAPLRITMIGGCPSGRDASIDTRIGAHDFLRVLVNRGISLTRQPAVFDSVLPPDRRRFFSLPGGCPAPKALETRAPDRRLVTITDENFSTELAELLLGGENVLIDLSPRLGCTCCGGPPTGDHWGPSGRDEIIALEPPRAPTPVVELEIEVPVDVAPTDPVVPPEREVRAGRLGDATVDSLRLPGAAPIGEARQRAEQRAERRRIAITPAAAMPAVPSLPAAPMPPPMSPVPPPVTSAPAPVPPASRVAAAPTTSASASSPSTSPDPSSPASRSMRTPTATIARNPALSAPELPTQGGTPGTYADLAGPPSPVTRSPDVRHDGDTRGDHEVRVERMGAPAIPAIPAIPAPPPPVKPVVRDTPPPVAAPPVDAGAAPTPDDAPRTTPSSLTKESREPAGGLESLVAAAPAVEPDVERARQRRAPSPRFLLSRAATHPRAQAGGGRILPRAYIRHTPTSMRAIEAVDLPDQERPLEVAVEPVVAIVGEPMVAEPIAAEPIAAEPIAAEPIAAEPIAAEPIAAEPIAAEPIAVESVAAEHAVLEPMAIDAEPSPSEVSVAAAAEESATAEGDDAASITEDTATDAFAAVTVIDVEPEEYPSDAMPVGEARAVDVDPTAVDATTAVVTPDPVADAPIEHADAPPLSHEAAIAGDPPSVATVQNAAIAPTAPTAPTVPPAPISDDVLARIRYQAQRHHATHPHRIIARDIQPPRESRAMGSLVRFIIVVVIVMAAAATLAIVLRRAPTAPW